MIHKAVACVIRETPDGPELLVFKHPAGMVQIPKGTVEPGESPERAVLRELEEESGLRNATIASIGPELAYGEDQTWHLFRLDPGPAPEIWQHEAGGSDVEDGLVFDFEWIALARARKALHPLYHPVVDALLAAAEGGV